MNGIFLGTLAFVLMAVGAEVSIVNIPSPVDNEAQFEVGEAPASNPGRTGRIVASSRDGARVVVAQAALITATHGSRIGYADLLESGETRLVLQSGGFISHVGSKKVVFELDGHDLTVSSAKLYILRDRDVWFVKVQELFSDAKPLVRYSIDNPEIPLEAAVDPTIEKTLELEQGKTFKLKAGNDPLVDPNESLWNSLVERLKEPTEWFVLEAQDVEDPADIITGQSIADGDMTEIEIEAVEIEIEADCVEICVD